MEEIKGGIHESKPGSVKQYFNYYSKLANQQNMMQDSVRTGIYHNAITSNRADFKDKVVMDVGAGSGILSLFSAKAGAKTVYAVEASGVARFAEKLVKGNMLGHIIEVRQSTIEDLNEPTLYKNVDTLVSEPLGTILLNERMLETYIIARDKFLKPGGKMFPSQADLCAAPFSDEKLYKEQIDKAQFWNTTSFFGINLTELAEQAKKEKLRQPIIEIYNPMDHLSTESRFRFDFTTCKVEDLKNVEFPLNFSILRPGMLHGVGVWFDAYFDGTENKVVLSTSPSSPATHWYQMRFLLPNPLPVIIGQIVTGSLKIVANSEQTMDITLHLSLPDLKLESSFNYDLKDPEYRWSLAPSSSSYSGFEGSESKYGHSSYVAQQYNQVQLIIFDLFLLYVILIFQRSF